MTDSVQTWKQVILTALLSASVLGSAAAAEADDMVDRGRYLVQIGGCNDCHTAGYLMAEGNVSETLWLTGDVFGWRGPWGTTYGSNLRLFMADLSEDEWIHEARTLKRRPPMPWFTLNRIKEDDLRAIYRFVRSLGAPGDPAPDFVPPDEEPDPPYAIFPSPPQN